jgi:hypothetical protein
VRYEFAKTTNAKAGEFPGAPSVMPSRPSIVAKPEVAKAPFDTF